MPTIYLITNRVNNKKYVGATINNPQERFWHHISMANSGSDRPFYKSIRKYGKESFSLEILEKNSDTNYVFNVLEEKYIKKYKSHISENGYNLTWGGDGNNGFKPSDATKLKISRALKGKKRKPLSEEHKRKISESQRGKTVVISEEQRKKISKTLTGRKNGPMPDHIKQKIREANIGKTPSKEHRKKIGDKNRKYVYIMSYRSGPEIEVKNIVEFCEHNNLDRATLYKVVSNKYPERKSHKGWSGKRIMIGDKVQ